MKRTEQILFHRLSETDFIRDVIIKQTVNIISVRSLRTCRHSQTEFRFIVIDNFLIAFCAGFMGLVNYKTIEVIRRESLHNLRLCHHLHRREQEIRVAVSAASGKQAHVYFVAEDSPVALQGLFGNLFPVDHKEYPRGILIPQGKCRCIGFSGSRRRNQQRPSFVLFDELTHILSHSDLHFVRRQCRLFEIDRIRLERDFSLPAGFLIPDSVMSDEFPVFSGSVPVVPQALKFRKDFLCEFAPIS